MAQPSIKELSDADLLKRLADLRQELRKLRFGLTGSPTKNAATARKTRRDIARTLTEMRRRALTPKEKASSVS
ncbi:50S ribosomal protein L29 [Candidatus Parcubacteria bacterium]|nr:MAG: 50S ribosomal protein L29 [Candidatus Parcubacteria bacterium]GIW68832.1 MAG: hypothetical protein KatS3mg100_326 [Candidatus Parcubacteria bacterium]